MVSEDKKMAVSARAFSEPEHLTQLRTAIGKAKLKILSLKDDWDENGSEAYEAATFEQAAEFLISNATRLWKAYSVMLEVPKILPGPDGSIDIHWEIDDRELLINIPPDPEKPRVPGDQGSRNEVAGSQGVTYY